MRPAATDTRNLIIQKDTACGADETKRGCDMSTDTSCLRILNDRACGLDFPRELLSRHISTDTRTLISTRDNFSATTPIVQTVQIHAQTQSTPTLQHDASSSTFPPAEQRHISVQAVQEPPGVKHSTTSIDVNVFHQLGHLRHSVSNTESKRSTDRSTVTERQQLCDLAINTEPKIMYSKDVGDFDVRIGDEEHEKEYVEHQEFTWNTLHGRRPPLHSQRITLECGFQTDLRDTKREVGYIERPLLKQREDTIEEQRQEIITFHAPRQSQETTTEETYQTVVTTEKPRITDKIEEVRSQIKHDDSSTTTIKSEFTEWSRTFGSNTKKSTVDIKKQEDIRSRSPEELVEESYEIVSTIEKPLGADSLITSITTPRSTTQQYEDLTSGKLPSSEDDSSYCEEWTVTEAKRKKDGQTVKTIIDRGGHHRYNIDTEHLNISSKDTSTETSSQLRHHSGFKLDEEMYIACAIVNESLYDKNADKKKVNNCLQLIQQEWFRISSQKQVNGRLVSGYLNSIKEHFSNFLLERIVNLQDANGNTALHYCVTNGHWHVVSMLLDTKVCDVCLQNNAGYTAVMMAAVIDIANDEQRQVVRRLFLESGNVNVKTTASNQTALMLAVQHEKADLVELLLENGAAVNLQDTDGSTALMCAVEHGSLTIVKLLLTRPECDVTITDKDGQTSVTIATNKDRKDILVALYAKMKERKGHHSALGSKSRTPSSSIPSRLPTADRSTTSSSNWKTSTETTASSSRRSSGDSGSNAGPTVSTFRRF
ncbi:unnamed protein product [Rotaria magnacalcarata]|uniref:KN motif and ankyrin repeat domain-containing protein 2 n=1 Tax=Rotaria magnacalcarata TaxID=392030 RepID=A0A8S2Q508_9BILA|nr:unnamed protein product [Rotaria magnacalcarata]